MVRRKIFRDLKEMDFIENNVVVSHQVLEETTESPETLHVIKSRQYRERGLFHISDAAYQFFLKLEQERVDGINISKLTKLQKNMVDKSIQQCSNNKVLFNSFENVFDSEVAFNKVKTTFQLFLNHFTAFSVCHNPAGKDLYQLQLVNIFG